MFAEKEREIKNDEYFRNIYSVEKMQSFSRIHSLLSKVESTFIT